MTNVKFSPLSERVIGKKIRFFKELNDKSVEMVMEKIEMELRHWTKNMMLINPESLKRNLIQLAIKADITYTEVIKKKLEKIAKYHNIRIDIVPFSYNKENIYLLYDDVIKGEVK